MKTQKHQHQIIPHLLTLRGCRQTGRLLLLHSFEQEQDLNGASEVSARREICQQRNIFQGKLFSVHSKLHDVYVWCEVN